MARVRCGRHDPFLRASHARGWDDQVDSAKDHRRRHRLALFERAQTRAEGVISRKREVSMPMQQSRRRFLTTLSIAGAATGLLRMPPVPAAEGALETTTVRIFANRPGICVAPQYIA